MAIPQTQPILNAKRKTDNTPDPAPDEIIAVSVPAEVLTALDMPETGIPAEPYSVDQLKAVLGATGLTMLLVAQRLREGLDAAFSNGFPDYRMRLEYAIKTLQAIGVAPMPGRSQAFIQVNNQPVIRDERAVQRVAEITKKLISVNSQRLATVPMKTKTGDE